MVMSRSLYPLVEALILVIILALITLGSQWIITTAPQFAQALATATLTPTLPVLATATDTPVPTLTCTYTPAPKPTETPTPTPTPTPAWTLTPSPMSPPPLPGLSVATPISLPVPPQPLPQPAAQPTLEQPAGAINILVLGSDQANTASGGLTDVIVIVSVNPELPSVSMLSIPRDLYAWIPGYGFDKINTAYSHGVRNHYPGGGIALVKATIEYNFGIPVHYYVRVGFDGFVRIVDALGGVDIAVECPLSDTFPDPDSPSGQTDVDWTPGIHHLDGKHALWYSRSRLSTSDFDRNRRQQQILRGLYRKILSLNVIPEIPELWKTLRETVDTDLSLNELLYLGNIGARLDERNIKSRFVGHSVLQSWTAPNGGAVLVPYYDALKLLVEEALSPPASGRAQQRLFRVEVWNGTPYEGLGYVAAERLRWEGFEVVGISPADGAYPRTQIVDFTTSAKASAVHRLIALYKRDKSDVIAQPTENRTVDYRVILGADYDPCIATRLNWSNFEPLPTPTPLPPPVILATPTSTPLP